MSRQLTIIVAAAMPSLGIGIRGQLPWKLKREMQYFRDVTSGGVVIMGRKTWDSIPEKFRPLKNRLNVVITRNPIELPEGCIKGSSLDDALLKVESEIESWSKPPKIFIIGGSQLYLTAMDHPLTTRILLTEISNVTNEFDTYFPSLVQWKKESFEELKKFVNEDRQIEIPETVEENGLKYEFTLYNRVE